LSQRLIIFLGPPGAGKGTQAERYTKYKLLAHISTGVMLRNHVENKTQLGVIAKEILDRGDLVPDNLVISMLQERLNEEDASNGAILDGFPRTIPQAQSLDGLGGKFEIVAVVVFEVNQEVLIQRMIDRGRSDDNENTIEQRFEVYKKETDPLINLYKDKNLIYLNGDGEEEEIFNELRKKLDPFTE
tara:strand:+ start:1041 stop:1601 length:561 start_codon:yes stop_codon:yes gene_type:complete